MENVESDTRYGLRGSAFAPEQRVELPVQESEAYESGRRCSPLLGGE